MAPKKKYSRRSILSAAVETVRESGAENLNTRTVAARLGCSTQPILYYFSSIELLKREIFRAADDYHTEYITKIEGSGKYTLKDTALRYIQFAVDEKNLFRFLFLSEYAKDNCFLNAASTEDFTEFVPLLRFRADISREEACGILKQMFMLIHGYACVCAYHPEMYDSEKIGQQIELVFHSLTAN